jgi:hypothetical protein
MTRSFECLTGGERVFRFNVKGLATMLHEDQVFLGPEGYHVMQGWSPDLVTYWKGHFSRLSDLWWWLDGRRVIVTYDYLREGSEKPEWIEDRIYNGIVQGRSTDKIITLPDGSKILRPDVMFELSRGPGSCLEHVWDEIAPAQVCATVEIHL